MDSSIRIALLDDEPTQTRAATVQLEQLGFEVRSAHSLLEFEKLVQAFDPQIILLDVRMPDASGDKVCRALKGEYETSGTPVLLYSALAEPKLRECAARAGADGYICKELGPAELKKKLNAVVSQMVF